jgi:NitT/TauT family transport system permease protein
MVGNQAIRFEGYAINMFEPPTKSPWLMRVIVATPFFCFLAVWQLVGASSRSRTFFFSTPKLVFHTLIEVIKDGSLLKHTSVTASEAMIGFVVGNVIGAAIGVLLWFSEWTAKIARPYIVVLGALPVFAIGPMTVLWFGIGFSAKVALAFLATVFLAAGQAYKGAEQVDPLLLRRFRIFGASRWNVFSYLLFPSASIWIIGSLRITIGAALLGAFIGEFIASEQGLGYMIIRASGIYDTPRVIVGVIVIVSLALILDYLVDVLEKKIFRWRLDT